MSLGRSVWGKRVVAIVAVALAGLLTGLLAGGCSGSARRVDSIAAATANIEHRIAGVWQLTSYVPDARLSPALLLGMQSNHVVVRFDRGLLRSETPSLTFERRYRVAEVNGDSFTVFIKDDTGVEYESLCKFDEAGRVHFQTVTAPWVGRGVLERQGAAPMMPR